MTVFPLPSTFSTHTNSLPPQDRPPLLLLLSPTMPAKKRCQFKEAQPCSSAVLRIVGHCPHCSSDFCGNVRLFTFSALQSIPLISPPASSSRTPLVHKYGKLSTASVQQEQGQAREREDRCFQDGYDLTDPSPPSSLLSLRRLPCQTPSTYPPDPV